MPKQPRLDARLPRLSSRPVPLGGTRGQVADRPQVPSIMKWAEAELGSENRNEKISKARRLFKA